MNKAPSLFAFALGNTKQILHQLKDINHCYLVFPNNIDHYINLLVREQPEFIIGMGSYSGIDQDKIRIETVCTNQFRNSYEGGNPSTIKIEPFIAPNETMKITRAMGNSYCNQVSYKIMQLIETDQLHSRYTFLHIPKRMNKIAASTVINQSINSI